jgi:hypothetical protein
MSSAAPAYHREVTERKIWHAGAALDIPYTMLTGRGAGVLYNHKSMTRPSSA